MDTDEERKQAGKHTKRGSRSWNFTHGCPYKIKQEISKPKHPKPWCMLSCTAFRGFYFPSVCVCVCVCVCVLAILSILLVGYMSVPHLQICFNLLSILVPQPCKTQSGNSTLYSLYLSTPIVFQPLKPLHDCNKAGGGIRCDCLIF